MKYFFDEFFEDVIDYTSDVVLTDDFYFKNENELKETLFEQYRRLEKSGILKECTDKLALARQEAKTLENYIVNFINKK
jgi:hypothetical protein